MIATIASDAVSTTEIDSCRLATHTSRLLRNRIFRAASRAIYDGRSVFIEEDHGEVLAARLDERARAVRTEAHHAPFPLAGRQRFERPSSPADR